MMNNKPFKNVIIVIGNCGSGKTTISKFLSKNSNFVHYEYDKGFKNGVSDHYTYHNSIQKENRIYDALFYTTNDLDINLEYKTKFYKNISIIYMNTSKNRCVENIKKREGQKWNLKTIEYDFKGLRKKYKFNLSIINNNMLHYTDCSGNINELIEKFLNRHHH